MIVVRHVVGKESPNSRSRKTGEGIRRSKTSKTKDVDHRRRISKTET